MYLFYVSSLFLSLYWEHLEHKKCILIILPFLAFSTMLRTMEVLKTCLLHWVEVWGLTHNLYYISSCWIYTITAKQTRSLYLILPASVLSPKFHVNSSRMSSLAHVKLIEHIYTSSFNSQSGSCKHSCRLAECPVALASSWENQEVL